MEQTTTELAHPVIGEVLDYLETHGIEKKDFIYAVRHYIDSEKSEDQFRLRHYRLMKGDYDKIRPDEVRAYRNWLYIERHRHQIFNELILISEYNLERVGEQVYKWIAGGYRNMREARRVARKIKQAGKTIRKAFTVE